MISNSVETQIGRSSPADIRRLAEELFYGSAPITTGKGNESLGSAVETPVELQSLQSQPEIQPQKLQVPAPVFYRGRTSLSVKVQELATKLRSSSIGVEAFANIVRIEQRTVAGVQISKVSFEQPILVTDRNVSVCVLQRRGRRGLQEVWEPIDPWQYFSGGSEGRKLLKSVSGKFIR